ncbi:hypothetical protein [Methylobacterium sp. NEAU K]|uniref:hypothetical protein n=1 Tax=Methylobacterium sp. NEAU K TaxID=3064946 RepID=UPI0027337A5B|nr:hypothetical protein [Methylobacterium sp. NEAU K]MDP4002599.1 hypothetical protein [Methylobacterium sp. NEAU K]
MLVFRGLTLALLQGASIGPFPEVFQLLAKAFLINVAGPWTSVLIGIVMSVALLAMDWHRRAVKASHGDQAEGLPAFNVRNGVSSIVILAFAYQTSSYRGLPKLLIVNFLLVMLLAAVCLDVYNKKNRA